MHKEVSKLLEQRLDAGWIEAVVVLVGMAISLIIARLIADSWNLHWIVSGLLAAPGFGLTFAAAHWLALRRNAREVRAILMARGHCASCGYSLAESPAAADGLTTCPECGAAWRLPGETSLSRDQ